MNGKDSVPSTILTARTIPEYFAAVETAHSLESVAVIPALAKMERRIPGWIRTLFGGSWRLLVAGSLFLIFFLLFSWVWIFTGQLLYQFLAALYPGEEDWLVIFLATAACGLLYADRNMYETITSHNPWSAESQLSRFEIVLLQLAKRVAQFMMLLFAALFVLFALLPILLTLWAAFSQVRIWVTSLIGVWDFVRTFYVPLLISLGLILLSFFLLKRLSRRGLVGLNILVLGGIGFGLVAQFLYRSAPVWFNLDQLYWPYLPWQPFEDGFGWRELIGWLYLSGASFTEYLLAQLSRLDWHHMLGIFMALAFLYPTGIARYAVRIWSAPSNSYSRSLIWFAQRIRLRWLVWQTIRHQQQRNRRKTGNNPWETVCQEHLHRFEKATVRRSYNRRLSFAHCPICYRDTAVYNGIRCLALVLADDFTSAVAQGRQTLRLNGLQWSQSPTTQQLPIFDVIIIGSVADKHDIELFFTEYSNQYSQAPKDSIRSKSLAGMTVQVTAGCMLDENLTNMLTQGVKVNLVTNYDEEKAPNPCGYGIRAAEVVQNLNRRTYGALKRTAKVAVIALVLTLLFIFGRDYLSGWWQMVLAWVG